MRHNQTIYLIATTIEPDSIRNQVEVPAERQVFANEFSVSSDEFYNAARTGLKPSKLFEIYAFEYRGEGKLRHGSAIYKIIRTQGKGEKLRLSCERVGADG